MRKRQAKKLGRNSDRSLRELRRVRYWGRSLKIVDQQSRKVQHKILDYQRKWNFYTTSSPDSPG
jgi:hypothetical protein